MLQTMNAATVISAASKSQTLAEKVRATLSAHGVRVLGAHGSANLMAFTVPAADVDVAADLLALNFGGVDGVKVTRETWTSERAAVYARNVPAEAGAGGRVRLVW